MTERRNLPPVTPRSLEDLRATEMEMAAAKIAAAFSTPAPRGSAPAPLVRGEDYLEEWLAEIREGRGRRIRIVHPEAD